MTFFHDDTMAVECLRLLSRARAQGLLVYETSIGAASRHSLSYTVAITPYRRRADGSVGRRKDRPIFFTGLLAQYILEDAAKWVLHKFNDELSDDDEGGTS